MLSPMGACKSDANALLQIREHENFHDVKIWTLGLFLKAMKSLQVRYRQIGNRLKCIAVYYYTFK